MRIAVVGVGAMGCLLGAYLGDATDVTLVGHWPEQISAIREKGLWLEQPDGTRSHHRLNITDDPLSVGAVDIALVVVKSRQTAGVAQFIPYILAPGGLAITLQNGLNNLSTLRRSVGNGRVTIGVTSEGATVLGVAEVRHAGHGPTFFGRDSQLGKSQIAKLSRVADLFNRCGFEAFVVDDTAGLVWGKLAVNAAINPLTALLRVPNGFLTQDPSLIELMRQIAGEVAQVAAAQGIELPFPDAGERALTVARATATNHSSMLQDSLRGVPTEVDAICGAVTRKGIDLGVPTPLNARLCRLVKRQQSSAMPLLERGDVTGLLRLMSIEIE